MMNMKRCFLNAKHLEQLDYHFLIQAFWHPLLLKVLTDNGRPIWHID